jgi:hypothetical protein
MVYKRNLDRIKIRFKPFPLSKVRQPVFVQSKHNPQSTMMLGGLGAMYSDEEGSKLVFEISKEGLVRKKPSMSTGRFGHAACSIRHFIVVVGGLERTMQSINGTDIPAGIKECQIYNILQEKWYNLPPLPGEKIQPSVVTVGERFIFVIGGIAHNTEIYCYDLYEFDPLAP